MLALIFRGRAWGRPAAVSELLVSCGLEQLPPRLPLMTAGAGVVSRSPHGVWVISNLTLISFDTGPEAEPGRGERYPQSKN